MPLLLRRKKDGFKILWEEWAEVDHHMTDAAIANMLPDFLKRDYEIVPRKAQESAISGKILVPSCGWNELTLDNFEQEMGYRFRIDQDQSMRGISRELAFLEFLESKGVQRSTKLVDGLTIDNFKEKIGHRFRMTKEDAQRGLSRLRAFEEWKKRNGYS